MSTNSTIKMLSRTSTIFVSFGKKYVSRLPRRSYASSRIVLDNKESNIVESPFPPITRKYDGVPFAEFITMNWGKMKGTKELRLSANESPLTVDLKNKVAMTDIITGESRTFANYHNDATSIAAHLYYDLGVDENTTIALFSPNHVDYVPISLAASICGAKLTPINPAFKADELWRILDMSGSSVLFVHEHNMDVAMKAINSSIQNSGKIQHIITIPETKESPVPEGTINLYDLKHHSSPMLETNYAVRKNKTVNHPFLLPYSSGTTGLPKGVCLSHHNLVANTLQFDAVEGMAFPLEHKLISPLPFFHIYGWLASAFYSIWKGNEVITMSRFDLEKFCQAVETHGPQRAHLVPPIVIHLAKNPIAEKYNLRSLQMIISAAAPLSKETEDALFKRIGCPVKQAWGMSELSPIGTFTLDKNIKSGSVGQLVPDTLGKIVGFNGQNLGPDEPGELMIKGPQVMMGYLNDKERTAECLGDDGWLRTGDVACYDNEGFFYITDRIKELIKVRGYQVAPAELEALLLTHPRLSDAAVVPVPDEISGQLPRAYVTRKKDDPDASPISEQDIQAWISERVAPYKRLEGGVRFIDQVPKSASGKILRRMLVDQIEAEQKEEA